jgi:uncharacterized protein YndB with AHSA1/START domain
MDRGTLVAHDGRPAVRFRRRYAHPVERLWAAITDPAELSHWFPSQVRIQPKPGGTIEFYGDPNMPETAFSGTILAFEPHRRLAFTFGGSELHFSLEPSGDDGCVLTLTDVLDSRDAAARNAAGWTVCLAELGKLLAGQAADGPHSTTAEPWQEHYAAFVAAGMPSGAALPGGA